MFEAVLALLGYINKTAPIGAGLVVALRHQDGTLTVIETAAQLEEAKAKGDAAADAFLAEHDKG